MVAPMGGVGHLDVDLIRESQLLKLEKLLGHRSPPSTLRSSCDTQLRQGHILKIMTCVSGFCSPFAPRTAVSCRKCCVLADVSSPSLPGQQPASGWNGSTLPGEEAWSTTRTRAVAVRSAGTKIADSRSHRLDVLSPDMGEVGAAGPSPPRPKGAPPLHPSDL